MAVIGLQNGGEGDAEVPEVSNKDMNDFISKVDDAIQPYDLAIRNMVDQRKGKRVWALVCPPKVPPHVAHHISHLCTSLSRAQTESSVLMPVLSLHLP